MPHVPPISGHALPPAKRSLSVALAVLTMSLAVLTTAVAAWVNPTEAHAAGSRTLTVTPGAVTQVSIGRSRVTSIASATFTVPEGSPVDAGFQFRASSKSSGYLTKLSVGADGALSGAFSRLSHSVQTPLGSAVDLGLAVTAGDVVHLQATVTAKSKVRIYLRAWKDGEAKPSAWQATVTDATSSRIKRSGRTYLWVDGSTATASSQYTYGDVSVRAFTARKAAKVGVADQSSHATDNPGDGTGTGTGTGSPFTIAVMPDTQDETLNPANTKFSNRTQWLVDNRDALNLKYVMHSGDVVNWGWLVPSQFTVARTAIAKLADAGIPYALTIGNHDTAAVGWNNVEGSTGYGGSAYMYNPECPSRVGASQCSSNLLVRRTDAFNAAFPLSSIQNLGGAFEAGKVDNIWTTFADEGSGTKWLVLTLELWPRKDVVSWAAGVVADHPDYNVLVQTHSYLTSGGGIDQSNGGYGATSGQYLYDNLIGKYANIKLVFSGHVGQATKRIDTGVHGNKIVSYLECFHSGSTNPVRIVTIDPASGKVTTKIYSPYTDETWSQYSTSDTIDLVR
ncbi:MAG: metallophosphoesterase [Actinobacteria bacterium]|nr:metallophosphoesterase [Actinomycetota bacterium]